MSVAMSWLVIVLVVVTLWAFWLWLGALFDWISDYHEQARAAKSAEAPSPDKERERS